ncbi:hypothetical protein HCN44_004726 [Aphidius gifuensis]|uniref:RRP12-like protein n=1 Tax=Aphidius gifuensis TaxID=684658 RepID=A0A835CTN7_APHGI|nr:RRP12-like protein [Aphidius gifuensis]KAF7995254.1 hypothetical protein HCN44_004726 [Aphidius gifuensis]
MARIKTKLRSKKGATRWPKGQSSSSNPQKTSYRDKALKSRYIQPETTGPKSSGILTVDALKTHEILCGNEPANDFHDNTESIDIDEEEQMSAKTFKTFASQYSKCSNITFDHFLKSYEEKNKIHVEMLAIVSTVTDMIKEKNGTESTVEYYAGIMTALEETTTKTERTIACLALLQMVLKNISRSLIKFEFSRISKIVFEIFEKYAATEEYQIQRYCIGCLSTLLKNIDSITWKDSVTNNLLYGILVFVVHTKPKVRKSAQDAICRILKNSELMKVDEPPVNHPAALNIAKYCHSKLENANKPGHITEAWHVLNLLKNILNQFPMNYVKLICEDLLKIMSLGLKTELTCDILNIFCILFTSQPSETILSAKLNAQIINALYDYQPSRNDIKSTPAWLSVMQEAYFNLVSKDIDLCAINLPTIIDRATDLWLSDNDAVIKATSHTIKSLIQVCMASMCVDKETAIKYKLPLNKIIRKIREGLKYQYSPAWYYVILIIQELYLVTKDTCVNEMSQILIELADLRDTHKFTYNAAVENAVGAAVRSLGPSIVLTQIPLQKSENEFDLRRSWLLPVLKQNIRESTLDYFKNTMLPLAIMCQNVSKELLAKQDGIGSHSYGLLYYQIWSLLPSFCNDPTDIKINFKSIAQRLGKALENETELRMSIMASIRKLIIKSTENNATDDINELSRFAKNFLPLLFNIYTIKPSGSDDEGQRRAAFETITVYLTIAPKQLVVELFDKIIEKIDNKETDDYTIHSLYDLLKIIIQYIDENKLEYIYNKFIPIINQRSRAKLQKKIYRIMEVICSSKSEICQNFVNSNRDKIESNLNDASMRIATIAKGARLRCIYNLIDNHPDLQKSKFLETIIREIVNCIKDVNLKCRTTAFELLDILVKKFLDNYDLLNEFIDLIIAKLDDGNYVSAALLGLSSIVFNHNGIIGLEKIKNILIKSCNSLITDKRDTVLSALSFIKVYITSMPELIVGPTVKTIIDHFCMMNDDCKKHFRQKIKNLLVKLTRKFGFDAITSMVPESKIILHKQLKNIRKEEARKQKARDEQKSKMDQDTDDDDDLELASKKGAVDMKMILEDSDDEMDIIDENENDKNDNKKTNQKKNNKKSWIQEKGDDIVDLADPEVFKNITRTKPVTNQPNDKKKIKNHGFKTADDGRFIIKDDDDDSDDDNTSNKKNKLPFLGSDSDDDQKDDNDNKKDDDDEDDGNDNKSIFSTKPGKRKRQDDASSVATSKYKSGGSGIHRQTKIPKTQAKPGSEYKSKKAPGDVKKKGKHDPYAYVPLSRASLNKRRKVKAAGRFKHMISGGKRDGKKNN